MAEKKVHGGVQFGVNFDDDHHPKVPCYAEAVDGQKCQEEGGLQFWVVWETQEGECDPNGYISLGQRHASWWTDLNICLGNNILGVTDT